ncbi:MAG: pectin acetylesterase-family hydrolase [Pseudomonadota bacterium]
MKIKNIARDFVGRLRPLLLLLTIPLSGCLIQIDVPSGATVVTESGSYRCEAGEQCLIEVVDLLFDETFSVEVDEGFAFLAWRTRENSLCGGSSEPCALLTSGFAGNDILLSFLVSDEVFFLEPELRPDAPLVSEALDCVDVPDSAVNPGTDLKKVTLSGDNAICNDGSPGVMYIRAAGSELAAQDWTIYFQGGSGCLGPDCAERWCRLSKRMSTLGTPDATNVGGIFNRRDDNQLGDNNQAFLYYCSSDNFSGQSTDFVVEESEEAPEYRIHFRGNAILNAALATLERGAVSDDQSVTLPPLGGEGTVTLSGASAGCGSLGYNADRVGERLQGLGLSTQVICDANFAPVVEFLPDDERTNVLVASAENVSNLRSENLDIVRDESCLELQIEEPWRCDIASYVLANHVTRSPVFVRMDLGDNTIYENYEGVGYTLEEFARGTREALIGASEGLGVEQPPRPLSVYGPACGRHSAVFSDNSYFETTVGSGNAARSYNDAVEEWIAGTQVVLVDTVPPTSSVCLN